MINHDPKPITDIMARLMKIPAALVFGSFLAACSSSYEAPPPSQMAPRFEPFTPSRTAYHIVPGDQLDITMHAVPEMSRSVTVGPDGRITMPLVAPIMVADLTLEEARQVVMQTMHQALVDPRLDLAVSAYAPQRIFVGGEVGQPGAIEMPGQIDPLQAIIMAGGFTDRSHMKQVIIIRRDPGAQVQSFSFDVKAGIYNPQLAQFGPLQRFDVVYVPKSPIARQNLFLQQYFRNALPLDFNFYYNLADRQNY